MAILQRRISLSTRNTAANPRGANSVAHSIQVSACLGPLNSPEKTVQKERQ
jgi:hypothetical protein